MPYFEGFKSPDMTVASCCQPDHLLHTLQVAAIVLQELLAASKLESASFEVRQPTHQQLLDVCGQQESPICQPDWLAALATSRQHKMRPAYANAACADEPCAWLCGPQVAAVVSQPGKPKGRGNKAVPVPSPVEQLARQHLPDTAILCPKSAKEVRRGGGGGYAAAASQPITAAEQLATTRTSL